MSRTSSGHEPVSPVASDAPLLVQSASSASLESPASATEATDGGPVDTHHQRFSGTGHLPDHGDKPYDRSSSMQGNPMFDQAHLQSQQMFQNQVYQYLAMQEALQRQQWQQHPQHPAGTDGSLFLTSTHEASAQPDQSPDLVAYPAASGIPYPSFHGAYPDDEPTSPLLGSPAHRGPGGDAHYADSDAGVQYYDAFDSEPGAGLGPGEDMYAAPGTGSSIGFFDPSMPFFQGCLLLLIALLSIGNSFLFDLPAGLEQFILHEMNVPRWGYAFLYSAYSLPVALLFLVLGRLADRYLGTRRTLLLAAGFLVVGQSIFVLGAYFRLFTLALLARIMIGLGSETIFVVQQALVTLHFEGRKLSISAYLILVLNRIGAVFGLYSSFGLANRYGYVFSLSAGVVVTLLILLAAIIVALMDRAVHNVIELPVTKINITFRKQHVKDLPVVFWVIAIMSALYYATFYSFIAFSNGFFNAKFPLENIALMTSIPYIVSIPAAPLLGFVINQLGRRIMWTTVAGLLALPAFYMLALTSHSSKVSLIILGTSFSIFLSTIWPMIDIIVSRTNVRTSFCLLHIIQHLTFAVVCPLTGLSIDKVGYSWTFMTLTFTFVTIIVLSQSLSIMSLLRRDFLNSRTQEYIRNQVKQQQLIRRHENTQSIANTFRDYSSFGTNPPPGQHLHDEIVSGAGHYLATPHVPHHRAPVDMSYSSSHEEGTHIHSSPAMSINT
ncbi:hypothetical protein H696_02727 [Fonticula alba]|uniref:Lysosomal dipeptide transporter MFSD1 n=1 Tax=Fonticula alba TaxID=691883 RepID=A0A058Z8E6_FONAL|nr:hypothetical protein H696_02727 [Fonticula alba]KCV70391.1 hypothetical protein H696_02727 [Fonticula alba]|eukprot:XP_009494907.1 hypothetical protein H696_02727 [Fonticula alba]